MRKPLTLFLLIQGLSLFIWLTMPKTSGVLAENTVNEPVIPHEAAETQVAVDFSMRNFDSVQVKMSDEQKEVIVDVLKELPGSHAETVEKIILDYNKDAGRGLGGNNMIILRGTGMSMEEFVSVLVHEAGHNVDYGYLVEENKVEVSAFKDGKKILYETDPSVDFFGISWKNEAELKRTATNMDFVSGYAMSDPFEDFAETYVYYVLHNKDFKALTSTSSEIYEKYEFMKNVVFNGVEFNTGDGQVNEINRPWDITVLDYDLAEFLS